MRDVGGWSTFFKACVASGRGAMASSCGTMTTRYIERSVDPAWLHYDDQLKFWVDGRYLPLYSYPSPGKFRPSQIESQLILEPER